MIYIRIRVWREDSPYRFPKNIGNTFPFQLDYPSKPFELVGRGITYNTYGDGIHWISLQYQWQ